MIQPTLTYKDGAFYCGDARRARKGGAIMKNIQDNRHRVNRAKDMQTAFAKYDQTDYDDVQPRDMLADIMHLCHCQGIDFDHELSMATDFFADEQ